MEVTAQSMLRLLAALQRTNRGNHKWKKDNELPERYTQYSILHPNLNPHLMTDSHRRPAIVPRDLVPAKLLLTISVSDVRVNIVVVENPTFDWIVVNTLPARCVDVVVRRQDNISAAREARRTSSVDLQTMFSTFPTTPDMLTVRLTNPPVAEDDLQTLILYSAPGAGRLVSR